MSCLTFDLFVTVQNKRNIVFLRPLITPPFSGRRSATTTATLLIIRLSSSSGSSSSGSSSSGRGGDGLRSVRPAFGSDPAESGTTPGAPAAAVRRRLVRRGPGGAGRVSAAAGSVRPARLARPQLRRLRRHQQWQTLRHHGL